MQLNSCTSFTHTLWDSILFPGALAIDMTCGNGHDTLFLAQKVLTFEKGSLLAIDLQKVAIDNTERRLKNELKEKILQKVEFIQSCHSHVKNFCSHPVDFIAYNLGYLPGSDKSVKTHVQTTLKSLNNSIDLLKVNGYLSITCYPGHEEGAVESEKVLEWAQNLSFEYTVTQHSWVNRSQKAPFLLLIQKR